MSASFCILSIYGKQLFLSEASMLCRVRISLTNKRNLQIKIEMKRKMYTFCWNALYLSLRKHILQMFDEHNNCSMLSLYEKYLFSNSLISENILC